MAYDIGRAVGSDRSDRRSAVHAAIVDRSFTVHKFGSGSRRPLVLVQ